jgi:NitT/TauT family transport system substrate-binding protein
VNRRDMLVRVGLVPLLLTACGSLGQLPTSTPTFAPAAKAVSVVPSPLPTPAAAATTAARASAATSVKTVTVDFAAKYAHYASHFIAIEKGYYADEGIDMKMIDGGVTGLLAGKSDFTTSPSSLLSAILKGADMKILFVHLDRPNYQLWSSQAAVKTLQDLAGKSVGILTRGDTTEISTRLLLLKAGLDPNGVAYTALSTNQIILAAVESGSVAAGVLTPADVVNLKQVGPKGSLLADTSTDIRMLFNGVGTSNKLLADDPKLVEGFLRGTIKGREYFRRFKDETVAILVKYNGRSVEANSADYDSVLPTMTADGTLSDDAATADASVRAGVIGVDKIRPLNEIYDFSLVKSIYGQLRQSGWQPAK